MPKRQRAPSRPFRIHFQSNPKAPSVFQLTRERYEAAAARHPEVARQVQATIGTDWSAFDEAMLTADALAGFYFPHDRFAERAPRVKWIHIWAAGVEHLRPFDWVPKGVSLINNSGVHAQKASEFAMMAILMLNNAMPTVMRNQREKLWDELFSSSVAGRTLAIVGVGAMGLAAAKRARQLDMRVIGVRRSGRPRRDVEEMYDLGSLDVVLRRADFLLLTIPLTLETDGLIGRRELDLLKPEACLINMSRARVVDYGALVEKLTRGELKGALLDVFDPEPLPARSPLWRTPNLVLTPHVGSDDNDRYMPKTLDLIFDNIARHLRGRPLRNRVRLSRGY